MIHKIPHSSDPSTDAEFHAEDDAWYSVRLFFSGETLTVKYCNFPDIYDEKFNANDFRTLQEIEDFGLRFRPSSVQLQDSECRKAIPGVMVCASFCFRNEDVRFYDACVDQVEIKEHRFANGEEECMCQFMLFWQHGPNAGNLTFCRVENICLIQPCKEVDQRVASFMKICRDKVRIPSNASLNSQDTNNECKGGDANPKEIFISKFAHMARLKATFKENKCSNQANSIVQPNEGRVIILREWIAEDIDLGGEALLKKIINDVTKHMMLIENLEKDLSHSTLANFVRNQTDISAEAFVLPSLPSDTYTRGIVVVNCKEKLEWLYKILDNPDYIIVSSKGRPWVISEKFSLPSAAVMSYATVMPDDQKGKFEKYNDLRVVHMGSEEYSTARKLRDLFTMFMDHQKQLHTKLEASERKILQLSLLG